MGRFTFRLPDIGEGIAEAEIVAWHVKVGDTVEEDGRLADMMTDKATVEMESPVAGTVVEVAGAEGDVIAIGSPLVVIETDGALPDEAPAPKAEVVEQRIEAETPEAEHVEEAIEEAGELEPAPTPAPAPKPVPAAKAAPKAFAKPSATVPSSLGHRLGSATMRQYWKLEAPSIEAASRHSRFMPSRAGVMIWIISGIWKKR